MKSLLLTLSLAATVLAAGRTSAPSGCLVVSKSPTSGQYSTVQKAVDALSTTSKDAQCIFIGAGSYTEQVLVPSRSAQLTIYGYTSDTSSYGGNKVTITNNKSQASTGQGNDAVATLRVKANGFRLYNVNVANTYGQGSQAVALSAYSDSGFYGCQFTGFQDTVLSNVGKQLFAKCLIEGATDFIFGQQAQSWFEDCDIRVLAASQGYVTGKFVRDSLLAR
jgi:pectinesterase